MLKQLSRLLFITCMCALLSACLFGKEGYIHNREKDYLKAQSEPPLKIPGNLKPANMDPAMPIPAGRSFSQAEAPSLAPPNEKSLQQAAPKLSMGPLKSNIGTGSDGFPVLKIQADYPSAFAKVTKSLASLGYQVIGSDNKTGIIEVMTPAQKEQSSTIYQFKIAAADNSTLISMLDQTGVALNAKTSKPMLQQLQTQLGKVK